MGFVKSVFIGLAVCAISYFAIFALAMAMAGGYGKDIADTVQVQMNSFTEAYTAWQHWQNQRL